VSLDEHGAVPEREGTDAAGRDEPLGQDRDGTSARSRRAAGWIPGNPSLCIPDLVLNDAGEGVGDQQTGTTAFPAPIAQSASWDTSLQYQFGVALGQEAAGKGINVQLPPGGAWVRRASDRADLKSSRVHRTRRLGRDRLRPGSGGRGWLDSAP
jgi:hypothetical protein